MGGSFNSRIRSLCACLALIYWWISGSSGFSSWTHSQTVPPSCAQTTASGCPQPQLRCTAISAPSRADIFHVCISIHLRKRFCCCWTSFWGRSEKRKHFPATALFLHHTYKEGQVRGSSQTSTSFPKGTLLGTPKDQWVLTCLYMPPLLALHVHNGP